MADWTPATCQTRCCVFAPARLGCSDVTTKTQCRRGGGRGGGGVLGKKKRKKLYYFFGKHASLMILCGLSDGSNTTQAACVPPWDHEQLLAHNYVVIHCCLEEKSRGDSERVSLFSSSSCERYIDSHFIAPPWRRLQASPLLQSTGTPSSLYLPAAVTRIRGTLHATTTPRKKIGRKKKEVVGYGLR